MGGGILTRNAFTLIELLVIIVILAIIAVITVPIILNIIENSRMGAAKDSAYGYKDSINKWYVSKLSENPNFNITDGEYKVGELGEKVEGKVPGDNSWFRISKNEVTNACFQFDEYKVEIKEGKVGDAEKGQCEELVQVPTIETCPGCKFIYTTSFLYIGTDDMPLSLTDDYTELTNGENGHPYFLGLIESTTNPGKIGRAFVCGIEGKTPFCLEGTCHDVSKHSSNVDILNSIFTSCSPDADTNYPDNPDLYCYGSSVRGSSYIDDDVSVGDTSSRRDRCFVDSDGGFTCSEF